MLKPERSEATSLIARRIRRAREARGWSAARMAHEMTLKGVRWDRFNVTHLEIGRRQNVTVDELLALACVLGVSPMEIIKEDPCAQCGGEPPPGYTCRTCGTAEEP